MSVKKPISIGETRWTSLIVFSLLILLWGGFCFWVGEVNDPLLTIDSMAELATFLVFYFGMYQVQLSRLPMKIRTPVFLGLFLIAASTLGDWIDEFVGYPDELEMLFEVAEAISLVGLISVSFGFHRWVRNQNSVIESQKKSIDRFRDESRHDGLTQLLNRAFFDVEIERCVSESRDDNKPLSLMLIDLDFFKKVNDSYGHMMGDQVLRQVAKTIRGQLRYADMGFRYGGEEFAMLLPQTSASEARIVAERLRLAIAAIDFSKDAETLTITASIGVSELIKADHIDTFIKRADEALYRAKDAGRNQAVVA